MALPLSQAFTARSLGVMWDNYKASLALPPYLGRQKFGTTKQDSLEMRYILGENSQPISLKASNFDAQAELRDVGGFQDIQNEMPFYRESYMVTEKEEQQYANYQSAENSNLANQVLRQISKKPMNLIQGAMVVPERQIWQLLAPSDGVPKVTVKIKDKTYTIDYTTDNGAKHKQKGKCRVKTSEEIKQKKCLKSSNSLRKTMRRKRLKWKASYIAELLMAAMAQPFVQKHFRMEST